MFILASILSSTATVYCICIYMKKEMIPEFRKSKIQQAIITYTYTIANHVVIYNYSKNFIQNNPTNLINILKYVFILEFFFYVFHRISHSFIYWTHAYHHLNIHLFPIDFLQVSYVDILMEDISMNLPLYIVPLNYMEYGIIYYVYMTGGYLVHSDILTDYHQKHHKYMKYNFCLLIPIYDYIFKTMK